MTRQDKRFTTFTPKGYTMDAVRVINGYHPLTVALIDQLKTGKPGDMRTDEDLTAIVGMSTAVDGKAYGYLASATRYCEKLGIIWQRVKGQNSIVCMNPTEVVARSDGDVSRVRRVARRAALRLNSTDMAQLDPVTKKTGYALAAQLGAIAMISRDSSTKAIAARVQDGVPLLGETLKIFDK